MLYEHSLSRDIYLQYPVGFCICIISSLRFKETATVILEEIVVNLSLALADFKRYLEVSLHL